MGSSEEGQLLVYNSESHGGALGGVSWWVKLAKLGRGVIGVQG